jgi:hypothetical protein
MVRDYSEKVAVEEAASGRERRERETLERSFERLQCKVGRRTWKRADRHARSCVCDPSDPRKQRVARDLLRGARAGETLSSTQVRAEFATTLLHKMAPAARARDVLAALDALSPIRVVVPAGDMVRRAVVAAAERGGCSRIWSVGNSFG